MASPAAEREAVFQRGLSAYRDGHFYEAHEIWEQLWEDEDDEDHRRFLQSLIQVASALHKIQHNVAPRGAARLLERAAARIADLPDVYGGVDLARFRAAVQRCLGEVERLLAEGSVALDPSFVPAIETTPDALRWRARPPDLPSPEDARRHLQLGVAAYRSGRYYEAHELWEVPWRDEPHPVMKAFLQGLILVAAAMHKLEKMGSPTGAVRLLERAGERLAGVPEGTGGMAIERLRSDVARAKAAIAQIPADADPRGALDPALVPRMDPVATARPS